MISSCPERAIPAQGPLLSPQTPVPTLVSSRRCGRWVTVVWATRIFGTLAFGKEAMGLGDVHLMGAAGAVIGAKWVVLAFFIAPFFGILWALYQAIFKKMRQIPYGPFLSLAVFAVIIFHDWIQKALTHFYGF